MQSTTTNLEVLAIRAARSDDAELLWSWRNDPETRRASRNTDPIPLDQHMRWFEGSLSRNERIMLIAMLGDEAIGTVRFDRRPDSYLEVSINIAPQARAKKLGATCLREACNFVLATETAGFYAEIRPDNAASIRIFQHCGFRKSGGDAEFLQFRRDPDSRPDTMSGSRSGDS